MMTTAAVETGLTVPFGGGGPPSGTTGESKHSRKRRRILHSVFNTEITQPTPSSTPALGGDVRTGHAFGVLPPHSTGSVGGDDAALPPHQQTTPPQPRPGTGTVGGAAPPSSPPARAHPSTTTAGAATTPTRARRRHGQGGGQNQGHAPHLMSPAATTGGAGVQPRSPHRQQHQQHDHTGGGRGFLDADVDDQLRFDRAWHVVTSAIALPPSVAAEDSFGGPSQGRLDEDPEFATALADVLHAAERLPGAAHTEDVLYWHTQQVRRHFVGHVLPLVAASASAHGTVTGGDGEGGMLDVVAAGSGKEPALVQHARVLVSSIRTLEAADRMYRFGIDHVARGFRSPRDGEKATAQFEQDLYAVVSSSLLGSEPAAPPLVSALRTVVARLVAVVLEVPGPASRLSNEESMALGLSPPSKRAGAGAHQRRGDAATASARAELHHLVSVLRRVGLAGERFQVLFAEVMDEAMEEFIGRSYEGRWGGFSSSSLLSHSGLSSSPFGAGGPASGGASRSRWGGGGLGTSHRHKASSLSVSVPGGGAGASRCMADLCDWVENCFARLAVEVAARMQVARDSSPRSQLASSREPPISWTTVEMWKQLALGRLATLRINELFSIVLAWPRSKGALDDLRSATSITPVGAAAATSCLAAPGAQQKKRLQLTETFGDALQKRLLHPGRSTLQILRVYIAMIRAFHSLDHSKVLLDRVMQGLRIYLCQREDAVRIVVSGLLVNPEVAAEQLERHRLWEMERGFAERGNLVDIREGPAELVELSSILTDSSRPQLQPHQRRLPSQAGDEELDWNDMDWMPNPVDAGQNYRRPKTEDVIGILISALGSQDVFIREFQSIVAERLLGMKGWDVGQELRVLKVLKKRFGEQALQATDVMLRDVHESIKLDAFVSKALFPEFLAQREKGLAPAAVGDGGGSSGGGGGGAFATPVGPRSIGENAPEGMNLNRTETVPVHAKILSRLFWPNLDREHTFAALPHRVGDWLRGYEAKYESLKSRRKLSWLHSLGTAQVELELEDRTVEMEVKTYEAAVISAFGESGVGGENGRVRKTPSQVGEELQMSLHLAEAALKFWVEKEVLAFHAERGDYWVRERLDETEDSLAAAEEGGGEQQHDASPGKGAVAAGGSKQEDPQGMVYWQFIVGMLTNSSASMPLAQISMMMKMLIAEGFPWTDEQLAEFLGEKVEEGLLEVVGGKYRLIKK